MNENKSETIIKRAYLFGDLGKAWYKQEGKLFVLSVDQGDSKECQVTDVELLYDASLEDPEIRENLSLGTILENLSLLNRQHTALLFALHGLDGRLTQSRPEVINKANELCQEEQVREFVERRLRDRPLPAEADINGAIQCAQDKDIIRKIYEDTKNRWPKVVIIAASEDRRTAAEIRDFLKKLGINCVVVILGFLNQVLREIRNLLITNFKISDVMIFLCVDAPPEWGIYQLSYSQRQLALLDHTAKLVMYSDKKTKFSKPITVVENLVENLDELKNCIMRTH